MKGRSVMGCCLVAAVVAAGAAWEPQIALPGKFAVQSVSDPHPKLAAGGPAVTVKLNGQNLGMITGCAVLLNGVVSRDITITLGPATTGSRSITLMAGSGLTASRAGYQLRMSSRDQVLDIPPTTFVMDVLVSSRTTTAVALPAVTRAYPPPNVDTVRLPSEGRVGTEITIWGRDFLPDRFEATIGTAVLVALQVTYRSTTQMRVRLPEQAVAGPLAVSHGTEGSRVQVKPAFTVYGRPVINAVRPLAFKQGDWVEITGQGLNHVALIHSNSSSLDYVAIGDFGTSIPWEYMVTAESWTAAAGGTSARFRAGRAYRPETNRLAGKIYLADTGTNAFVAGPPGVTWTAGPSFVIDSVHPAEQWNGQNVDFILLRDQTNSNTLMAKGTGIVPGTQAKMGAVTLVTGTCSGTQADFRVPYSAATNFVQFASGTSTAQSPAPIRVAVWPKWDPATPFRIKIVLNTEYTLRGWGFKPTAVTGLAHALDLALSAALPLRVQVLEHTDNLIRFKVVTTASLPANYMTFNEFNSQGSKQLFVIGRYQGGTPKILIERLYYLATQ